MKRKFVPRRELSTLTELYCTPGEYVLPSILRLAWRGKTVEGGDGDQVQESSTSGSRKTDQDRISSVISRYNFGDMCESFFCNPRTPFPKCLYRIDCGAGGATCGAEMAGLQIRYGLNSDTDTGLRETWTNAFPKARFYHITAEELIAREDEDSHLKVDVLHLSPPCQFYSRPKTTPSEKDVSKRTQIFFTGALLQKGTPRIAILEETAGLLDVRHGRAFN
jgi:DNA (cytosine-5)-methyltransferase 1